jgi:Tfp pilus assembly protein PilE
MPPRFRDTAGRLRRNKGFTIFEVAMAATIFAMSALALFSILIEAYGLVESARYRDAARAVLRTYADQFERLEATDKYTDSKVYTRWLFQPAYPSNGTGTGAGLSKMDVLSDVPGFTTPQDNNGGTGKITLGGPQSPATGVVTNGIAATVTRTVELVQFDPTVATANGQIVPFADVGPNYGYSGGTLYLGTFTITYTVNNKLCTQSISVLRDTL